jgi:hypothetical protein
MQPDSCTIQPESDAAAFCAHLDQVQEQHRQELAELKPHELARFELWLRTRTRTQPPTRPRSRPVSGRAPREAANTRSRGSRRGVRASASSSDDPGGDEPGESEPSGGLLREAGRLEEVAGRPLQSRRDVLLTVASRLRALDAALAAECEQLGFDGEAAS